MFATHDLPGPLIDLCAAAKDFSARPIPEQDGLILRATDALADHMRRRGCAVEIEYNPSASLLDWLRACAREDDLPADLVGGLTPTMNHGIREAYPILLIPAGRDTTELGRVAATVAQRGYHPRLGYSPRLALGADPSASGGHLMILKTVFAPLAMLLDPSGRSWSFNTWRTIEHECGHVETWTKLLRGERYDFHGVVEPLGDSALALVPTAAAWGVRMICEKTIRSSRIPLDEPIQQLNDAVALASRLQPGFTTPEEISGARREAITVGHDIAAAMRFLCDQALALVRRRDFQSEIQWSNYFEPVKIPTAFVPLERFGLRLPLPGAKVDYRRGWHEQLCDQLSRARARFQEIERQLFNEWRRLPLYGAASLQNLLGNGD
jgi:hypothetical protein